MMTLPCTFTPGFHRENEIAKIKYNVLGSTGLQVSNLSLGTGGFSYFYGEYSLEECKLVVEEALKSGINYIDTGPWYGHGVSEQILGKCLKNIPRSAYYIATKVGRYEADPKRMFDFSAEKTRKSVENSLKVLGVDYIDIMQVHDVEFAPSLDIVLNETLPTLQEFVKEGKIRYIGVTGYPNSVLKEVIEKSNKINCVLSYTRLTMIDQSLKQFIPFYKSKNVGIINASVHGMGLLTNSGPPAWHPAPESLKIICANAAKFCKENDVELGRLAVYFALQEEGPSTILCGTNTRDLLRKNVDVVKNGLNAKELKIYGEVRERFFNNLQNTHWEGIELEKFRSESFVFSTNQK
ncbi:hypothetical protein WA026_006869 [Henosepilachna vigintioctopunctata]|uniref:NADP-dependent oxidoreductase domain-containing protein n=1 Tax=Henosepilachna vigintioctopunctata TaxID=420089 RepID=A0AAW1UFJ4_9CUCU